MTSGKGSTSCSLISELRSCLSSWIPGFLVYYKAACKLDFGFTHMNTRSF